MKITLIVNKTGKVNIQRFPIWTIFPAKERKYDIFKAPKGFNLKKEIIQKIRENCIKHHTHHKWNEMRENGAYGELFYVCENCNAENY